MKPTPVLHRFYEVFPSLTAIANASGYALAVHGSLARDIDLVAVPWTRAAVSAEDLIRRFVAGRATKDNWPAWTMYPETLANPTHRAHGRRAWVIQLPGKTYIDLSVMPRIEADTERERAAAAAALYGRLEPHGA